MLCSINAHRRRQHHHHHHQPPSCKHSHTHTMRLSSVLFFIHFYFLRNIICWTWHFCLLLLLFVCFELASGWFACSNVYTYIDNKLWEDRQRFEHFHISSLLKLRGFCFSFGKYDFAFVCLLKITNPQSEWNEYEWTNYVAESERQR